MTDFTMPSLGADMEDGTLAQWLVKPGDAVRKGDIVAVIETQKGAIDVEIFDEGTVSELCVPEGETVPVGTVLAHIQSEEKAAEPGPSPKPAATVPPASEPAPIASPLSPPPSPPVAARTGRAKVSPAARRLAVKLGIDPDGLVGTGVDGSVTLADVELARTSGALAKPSRPPARRGGFDPAEMRRAIGAAMARSKREIPHYYLSSAVDMTPALDWLAAYNEGRPPTERMLAAALLMKASALALREHPQLNGFWQDGAFRPGPAIHVGWAVSLRGGGLVAPAVHDADSLALPELMAQLRDVVRRARAGGLRSSELMDPTVTVTSLGERGADSVIGVIYPPQVAIVGFGRITERPWVAGGKVVPRQVVEVSLAADHRASDGHRGGLFLSTLERLLQEPEKL